MANGKRGAPRGPQYHDKVPEQAAKLCALGATDREIADFFDIPCSTFYTWRHRHPEFAEALKAGKELADDRVERSLYNRAVGYSYDSERIMVVSDGRGEGSSVQRVSVVEHVAPDVKAAHIWLTNRRKETWSDTRRHQVSGPNGEPLKVITTDMTPAEAAAAYAATLAQE